MIKHFLKFSIFLYSLNAICEVTFEKGEIQAAYRDIDSKHSACLINETSCYSFYSFDLGKSENFQRAMVASQVKQLGREIKAISVDCEDGSKYCKVIIDTKKSHLKMTTLLNQLKGAFVEASVAINKCKGNCQSEVLKEWKNQNPITPYVGRENIYEDTMKAQWPDKCTFSFNSPLIFNKPSIIKKGDTVISSMVLGVTDIRGSGAVTNPSCKVRIFPAYEPITVSNPKLVDFDDDNQLVRDRTLRFFYSDTYPKTIEIQCGPGSRKHKINTPAIKDSLKKLNIDLDCKENKSVTGFIKKFGKPNRTVEIQERQK